MAYRGQNARKSRAKTVRAVATDGRPSACTKAWGRLFCETGRVRQSSEETRNEASCSLCLVNCSPRSLLASRQVELRRLETMPSTLINRSSFDLPKRLLTAALISVSEKPRDSSAINHPRFRSSPGARPNSFTSASVSGLVEAISKVSLVDTDE